MRQLLPTGHFPQMAGDMSCLPAFIFSGAAMQLESSKLNVSGHTVFSGCWACFMAMV